MKDGGLLTLNDLMLLLPPRCANSEPLNPTVPFILVNMHYSNKNNDDFGNSKNSNDLIPTDLEVPSIGEVDGKFIPSDLSSQSTFPHPLPSISDLNQPTQIHRNHNHSSQTGLSSSSVSSVVGTLSLTSGDREGESGIIGNSNSSNNNSNNNHTGSTRNSHGSHGDIANPNPSILSLSSSVITTTDHITNSVDDHDQNTTSGNTTIPSSPPSPTPSPPIPTTATSVQTNTTAIHRNYFDVISLHRSGGRNSQSLGIRTLERCRYIVVHNRK